MSEFPTDELVAVAWAKTLMGVDATKVAATLPADASQWAATGFVVASVVGGNAATHTPLYGPVIRFDCWAANPGSNKAPQGRASSLAHGILWGTYSQGGPQTVGLPAGFYPVHIHSVFPVGAVTRVPADEAGFARSYLDVRIHWTPVVAE